ncbi:MAG: hypothetical protein ABIT64_04925 [Lysobacteraceae bacterium]
MPRLVPMTSAESPALLALRRSVWQLAVLGITTALALVRIAPQYDVAAAWSALFPLTALATLYRHELLGLIRAQATAAAAGNARRRRTLRKQPQARRAISDRSLAKPHQLRTQHAMG